MLIRVYPTFSLFMVNSITPIYYPLYGDLVTQIGIVKQKTLYSPVIYKVMIYMLKIRLIPVTYTVCIFNNNTYKNKIF